MQRDPLSRRALLRIGGLGVLGLSGCVFGDGDRAGRRTAEQTTTRTTRTTQTTTQPTTAKPTTAEPT